MVNVMKLVNKLVSKIYNEPEVCKVTSVYFNIGSKYRFWVGNGFIFFNFDNCKTPNNALSIWERWRVWKAYKWWIKNMLVV